MISPKLAKTLRALRRLARTKTQAEAAQALDISRQRVFVLSRAHKITFCALSLRARSLLCSRCRYAKNGNKVCLRCKWTPSRIRRLRKRYGLSQVNMSYKILGLNVWAVTRWENGRIKPSRRSLEKLELAEKA